MPEESGVRCMSLDATIVMPYHERGRARDNLVKVFAGLRDQGKYSFPEIHFNPVSGLKTFRDTKENIELLIITDEASPPEFRKNVCHKTNVGIQMARGEVIVSLQQDIVATPGTIERAINHLLLFPNVLLYPMVFKQNSPGDHQPGPYKPHQGAYEKFQVCSFFMVFNRERMISVGGLDEDFATAWGFEDYEFMERASRHFSLEYTDYRMIPMMPTPQTADFAGVHLWHPEAALRMDNQFLYYDKLKLPDRIANEGRKWGVLYDGEN